MIINIPSSLGELLDKISILLIKKSIIIEHDKLKHVSNELSKLQSVLNSIKISRTKVEKYINELKEINLKLWNIEDEIRECEKDNFFEDKFIHLARSVYKFNDQRSKIKLRINREFDSEIVEVKSYKG